MCTMWLKFIHLLQRDSNAVENITTIILCYLKVNFSIKVNVFSVSNLIKFYVRTYLSYIQILNRRLLTSPQTSYSWRHCFPMMVLYTHICGITEFLTARRDPKITTSNFMTTKCGQRTTAMGEVLVYK